MKEKLIITLSGRICSGKSHASELLSNKFGIPVASFGGYLKYYCQNNNLPIDRNTLQEIGDKFVKERPTEFLLDVIKHFKNKSDSIVVEGVRHTRILENINQLADKTISIFIEADQKARYDRYIKREKYSDDDKSYKHFLELDNHPIELEIDLLKPKCDIVVKSTDEYSNTLIDYVSKLI